MLSVACHTFLSMTNFVDVLAFFIWERLSGILLWFEEVDHVKIVVHGILTLWVVLTA